MTSVRANTDLTRNRLVVVVDGPQGSPCEALLADLSSAAGVVVLRQEVRRGFVAAANRGMAASPRDVVLLNSDTVVTPGWLDKLRAAANSSEQVATVTPFSNDATICSLPRWLVANALPAGHDVESFGALVERSSERVYPPLPTGVGVCLFIKRAVLDRVGRLDEKAFGLGYGEESDLCARASAAGYIHVLADDTFVFHEGRQSFGASRRRREDAAQRVLRRRHPSYWPAVARFIREDPLREVRERVMRELAPPRRAMDRTVPARVLHVVHGWPPFARGGTEQYAASLARRQATFREVAAFARLADPARAQYEPVEMLDHGVRVHFRVNNFVQRDPLARNALHDGHMNRALAGLLDEFRPDLVHVHHLAGHGASLLGVARRRGVPIVVQLQDWWSACARANLVDRSGAPCEGPSLARCAACLPLTSLPAAPLLNRLLHALRRRVLRQALAQGDAYVAGSRFIVESLRALGVVPPGKVVQVLPYGVEQQARTALRSAPNGRRPLVFGFIGALMPHKGAHIVTAAFVGVDPKEATLEVWGDPAADPTYAEMVARLARGGPVRLRGAFADTDRAEVFGGIDVLLLPSIGLESFGLVAREAMARGIPVLASRHGALGEIPGIEACGALVAPGDEAAWRGWVDRLLADPAVLERWRHAMPPIKGIDEHAGEVEAIYREVLDRSKGH